jgi:hypothetical protein
MIKLICWFSAGVTSAIACKLAIDKFKSMGINNKINNTNSNNLDIEIIYIETGAAHNDNIRFMKDCERLLYDNRTIKIIRSTIFNSPLQIAERGYYFNTPQGSPTPLKNLSKTKGFPTNS